MDHIAEVTRILAMVETLPADWPTWAGHRAVMVEILLEADGGLLGHVDREGLVCSLARIRDLACA